MQLALFVPVFVLIDGGGLREVVLDQTMFQLFTRDARRLQRSRILEERGCACHDLPSAPGRQHHVRKLALWSFCLHIHLSLFLRTMPEFRPLRCAAARWRSTQTSL